MRKWFLICGAGAIVGYAAVYFALGTPPTAPAESEPPVAAAPAEPVVPGGVVDVADLDSLLDARPAEPAGLPFDAAAPPELVAPTSTPAPIPMAAD